MSQTTLLEVTSGKLHLPLEIASNATLILHGRTHSRTDFAEIVAERFDQPSDFPPLVLALLEDDTIAIALEDSVPSGEAIAAHIVRYLVDHGVQQEKMTIVMASNQEAPRSRLQEVLTALQLEPRIVQHDPKVIDNHAYLAASESADAIYVQREIVDADVAIPIYCARTKECPNASDLFGIAPCFTDAATQQRWAHAWIHDTHEARQSHRNLHEKLSREAGWLVGIHFAVAVVPSVDGHVADILAGKPELVFHKATEGQTTTSDSTYDLVVAVVEGSEDQQSWLSIARAASQANSLCNSQGRIVVCCDISKAPRAIKDLASDAPLEEANKRVLQSHAEDAFSSAVLRCVQQERSLYLYSSLKQAETEAIGFAYIQNSAAIQHLISQVEKVCIIRGAQY